MKKYILIPLILLCLTGCENEIPFNLNEMETQLILNAMIGIDESENHIFLNYTDKTNIGLVTDGVVEIRVNGELRETPVSEIYPQGEGYQVRYRVRSSFEPGDIVRVDAYANNEQYHAWAEETVPQLPIITAVDTFQTHYESADAKQLKYKVGIKDKPGERNFYRIELKSQFDVSGKYEEHTFDGTDIIIEVKDTVMSFYNSELWPWEDIVLTDGKPAATEELDQDLFERVKNRHGIFDNKRFVGKEYTMTVSTSYPIPMWWYYPNSGNFIPESMDVNTTVRLHSITESEYYYLNVLNYISSDIADEYLTDPVKLYSNVHGGLGIFTISSETNREFEIMKDFKFIYGEE